MPAATVKQLGIDPAFSNDPGRQRALSPTWQAAAPNAPAFLLLHVQRLEGTAQARGLARAPQWAGTPVAVAAFGGRGRTGHIAINSQLGRPDDPANRVVDGWLKKVVGR